MSPANKSAAAHTTREAWLTAALPALTRMIREAGAKDFAAPMVSVGFPSSRALGKNKAIGECWTIKAGKERAHIFVHPCLDAPVRVLDVLLHELIHAATPGAGHKGDFRTIAKAVGLEGKMTATIAGKELTTALGVIADQLGAYPHPKLDPAAIEAARKKQTTRMHKVVCPTCGYTVRVSAVWLDQGLPTCCCGDRMQQADAA